MNNVKTKIINSLPFIIFILILTSLGYAIYINKKTTKEVEEYLYYTQLHTTERETGKIEINNENENDLTWESSNNDVVEVDQEGNYVTKNPGVAQIIIKDDKGNKEEIEIVVSELKDIDTSIETVKPTEPTKPVEQTKPIETPTETTKPIEPTKPVGQTKPTEEPTVTKLELKNIDETLSTNFTYNLNTTIEPSTFKSSEIVWKSSDTKIATVSNGLVTTINPGTVTITATLKNKTASIDLKVENKNRLHFISHGEAVLNDYSDHVTGDAILLESDGHYAMIDLGNKNIKSSVKKYIDKIGNKTLDLVILTHMDSDHAGNYEYLTKDNTIKVKQVFMKKYTMTHNTKTSYDRYVALKNEYILNKANNLGTKVLTLENMEKHTFDVSETGIPKVKIKTYNTNYTINSKNDENSNSLAILVNIHGYRVALTGDLYDTKLFNSIANNIGKIDILKLPHHGSRFCALLPKEYDGDKITNKKTGSTKSTAYTSLNPDYIVVTSSRNKIKNIRSNPENKNPSMCVDTIPSKYKLNTNLYYVDEKTTSLIFDLTSKDKINIINN